MANPTLPHLKWLPQITVPPAEPINQSFGFQPKASLSAVLRVAPRSNKVSWSLITDANLPTLNGDSGGDGTGESYSADMNGGSAGADTYEHFTEEMNGHSEGSHANGSSDGADAPAAGTLGPKSRKKPVVGEMTDAADFLDPAFIPVTPPEVIKGLLHRGSIMSLGGSSKSHKSFSLLDLAVSVSSGEKFWNLSTVKGRVLYVNLELQEFEAYKRLTNILSKRGISLGSRELGIWNLRGFTPKIETIVEQITDLYGVHKRKPSEQLDLIIIDPIYKCYGGRDENNASDIASLFAELERLANDTNAAVVFAAHFAKGDSKSKAVVDRISGSGVYGRYPDSIMTVTAVEHHPDHFEVEAVLRNFASLDPIFVKWDYPLLKPCPKPATTVTAATGRAPKYSMAQFTALLTAKPLTKDEWEKQAVIELSMPKGTFKDYKRDALGDGLVAQVSPSDERYYEVKTGIPKTTALATVDPSTEPMTVDKNLVLA